MPAKIRFNPGPTTWAGPRGWFRPEGKATWHGPKTQENPERWSSRVTWAGRLFVGLNVKNKPKWKPSAVVAHTKKVWGKGASFISQQGFWPSPEGLVPEKSVQIIILNTEGLAVAEFRKALVFLAEVLAAKLQQDEVIVEIQRNGVVKETVGVYA